MAEEVGVEPTRHVTARLTGFEDQVSHRGYRSSFVIHLLLSLAGLSWLHSDWQSIVCCRFFW